MQAIPASAIVPTRNRATSLRDALASLERQLLCPAELVVVDASDDTATRDVLEAFSQRMGALCSVRWEKAHIRGAAIQRNQGVSRATQPYIWFFDDDILFEPECVQRLWHAVQSDPRLGGVNATIVNQRYKPPGSISRLLFTILKGQSLSSFAGLVIGPAVNLLPEDREDLPAVVDVEWINTGCTIYRRDALPSPPFDSVFEGYSMMEDLALSLRVGKTWRLANARTARIVHDSQPGDHKTDVGAMATMELVNRHYVMTKVLDRRRFADYVRLVIWESFQLVCCLVQSRAQFPATLRGKIRGIAQIRTLSTAGSVQ